MHTRVRPSSAWLERTAKETAFGVIIIGHRRRTEATFMTGRTPPAAALPSGAAAGGSFVIIAAKLPSAAVVGAYSLAAVEAAWLSEVAVIKTLEFGFAATSVAARGPSAALLAAAGVGRTPFLG